MNLSEHFTDHELGVDVNDSRLVENATKLCELLLEPIRRKYGKPLVVHDGYRPPAHNSEVGGKATSFHLFTGGKAAADFHIDQLPLTQLFNWIRLESSLPFDKVILEHGPDNIPRCVHVQVNRLNAPRRQAYLGSVGDGQTYIPQEVR